MAARDDAKRSFDAIKSKYTEYFVQYTHRNEFLRIKIGYVASFAISRFFLCFVFFSPSFLFLFCFDLFRIYVYVVYLDCKFSLSREIIPADRSREYTHRPRRTFPSRSFRFPLFLSPSSSLDELSLTILHRVLFFYQQFYHKKTTIPRE